MRTLHFNLLCLLLIINQAHSFVMGQDINQSTKNNPLLKFKSFVQLCEKDDSISNITCCSYITGFVAGYQATLNSAVIKLITYDVINGKIPPTDQAMETAGTNFISKLNIFCIKSVWTAGYIQAIVVQYAKEHPEKLNDDTASCMLDILVRAFPCEAQSK
jgi:hypothetical protein